MGKAKAASPVVHARRMLVPMSGVVMDSAAMTKMFLAIVADGTLPVVLDKARMFVLGHVPVDPLGVTASIRKPAEIKALIDQGTSQVMFSATLANLALATQAHRTPDTGRIKQLLDLPTIAELRGQIGPIIVNRDAWLSETTTGLHRCDKDGEIDALCLLMYWCQDNTAVMVELDKLSADLVFDCRSWGTGSKLCSNKTKQLDMDESNKKTLV